MLSVGKLLVQNGHLSKTIGREHSRIESVQSTVKSLGVFNVIESDKPKEVARGSGNSSSGGKGHGGGSSNSNICDFEDSLFFKGTSRSKESRSLTTPNSINVVSSWGCVSTNNSSCSSSTIRGKDSTASRHPGVFLLTNSLSAP